MASSTNIMAKSLPNSCGMFLSTNHLVSKPGSLRQEVQDLRTQLLGDGPLSFLKPQTVRMDQPYVRRTIVSMLKKMKTKFYAQELEKSDFSVATAILIQYTEELLDLPGHNVLLYEEFLKLSHTYARHFNVLERLQSGTTIDEIIVNMKREPLFRQRENLFATSKHELQMFLVGVQQNTNFSRYNDFLKNSTLRGYLLVPTFANLGFETILWGMSRGILFIGLSDKSLTVDGFTLNPIVFFEHDLVHGEYFPIYNKRMALFWDSLSEFAKSIYSIKMKKLFFALAFYLFHENHPGLSCKSFLKHEIIKKSFHGKEFLIFEYLKPLGRIYDRLSDTNDLGLAFATDIVSPEEILIGSQFLTNAIKKICGIK